MSGSAQQAEQATTVQPTTGTLRVGDGSLYYEVAGAGHPLVLIHAGVADSAMWDDQFEEFAQRYRVIRYDTRGFGQSKTEDVEFSDRQDLHDLLKHLDVEMAHVIGTSRAGQIAVEYTLEHPEMVSALVVVAAGLDGLQGEPTEAEMALFIESGAAEEAKDWAKAAEMDVRIWGDGPLQAEGRFPEALREKMRRMCLNIYTAHTTKGKPQQFDPPAATRLSEIKAPTLIVLGDYDVSPIITMSDQLKQAIVGARKVVIPGTAHMVPMEKPQEFNKTVLDFLGELDK